MDEGYIKFNARWKKIPPIAESRLRDIVYWRDVMRSHGLIGVYGNGVGYGNISKRTGEGTDFIITCSATGHLPTLTALHFSTVTGFNMDENTIECLGPCLASSESMSHAVIYRECPEVNGVIHVHDQTMWKSLLHKVPTTEAGVAYGSPEMAESIINLLKGTDLREKRLFVMEGHPEGIFSFGATLDDAAEKILSAKKDFG